MKSIFIFISSINLRVFFNVFFNKTYERVHGSILKIFNLVKYIIGCYLGLVIPDLDLVFLHILHHRSIITHSILLPWILQIFFLGNIPREFIAGIYCGIAIHLSADILSSFVGFGMIWLPWPIKISLGLFSPVWVAMMAFWAIKKSLSLSFIKSSFLCIVSCIIAFSYSIFNEKTFVPFVIFCIFFYIVSVLFFNKNGAKRLSF